MDSRIRRRRITTAAVVLATPLVCVVLMTVAMLVASYSFDMTPTEQPLSRGLQVASALAIGVWGWFTGRRSALRGYPLALAAAVAVPIGLTASILDVWLGFGLVMGASRVSAIAVWAAGMLLTLWLAAHLARLGQRTAAFVAGIVGATASVDLALMSTLPATALLWPMLVFEDAAGFLPSVFLAFTPFALAYAISGGSGRRPYAVAPKGFEPSLPA